MKKSKKFVKPFRKGDVVQVKHMWPFNGRNIINEVVMYEPGHYEYSTDRGAWIPHSYMTLTQKCSESSLKELLDSNEEDVE